MNSQVGGLLQFVAPDIHAGASDGPAEIHLSVGRLIARGLRSQYERYSAGRGFCGHVRGIAVHRSAEAVDPALGQGASNPVRPVTGARGVGIRVRSRGSNAARQRNEGLVTVAERLSLHSERGKGAERGLVVIPH